MIPKKPDWKDAPEWANWLAQDEDGEWPWFEEEPTSCEDDGFFGGLWWGPVGKSKYEVAVHTPMGAFHIENWRETLERRPEAAQ